MRCSDLRDSRSGYRASRTPAISSFSRMPKTAIEVAEVSVLWDTGERIGAVLQLEWQHLNGTTLHVPAGTRKGKTRDKMYSLHPDTVALLETIHAVYGGSMLLPLDCCYESLFNRLRAMLNRAGLPSDRKHLFHCIRRSVASHGAAAGADASQLLDHSDPSITRRYYLDPRIVPAPRAVDVLFRPDSPRPAA